MMLYVTLAFLCVVLLANTLYKKEKWYAPLSLFSIIWIFIIGASQAKIYDLYDISFNAQIIVFLGCVGFVIGSLPCKFTLGSRHLYDINYDNESEVYDRVYNQRLAHILSYACIALVLIEAASTVRLLLSGYTFENVVLQKEFYSGGTIWNAFAVFFSYSFVYAILPIGALNFVKPGGDKKITLLAVIIAVLRVLHHGGRATIVYFLLYVVLFSKMYGKKFKIPRWIKFLIAGLMISGAIALVIVSSSRGIQDFEESIYLYLCGCLPNLDQRLDYLDSRGLTLGGSSLYGYISPIMFIYKGFFEHYPKFFSDLQNTVNVENIIHIGQNYAYNAFVTPFYYLYADMREFGVFLGMVILGVVCESSYKKIRRRLFDKDLVIYSLLFFQIVFSMVRMHFSIYQYALAFFYIHLIYKKRFNH